MIYDKGPTTPPMLDQSASASQRPQLPLRHQQFISRTRRSIFRETTIDHSALQIIAMYDLMFDCQFPFAHEP